MQKFRVLFGGKDRFVIKIPVLTPKRGFLVEKSTLHLKSYFTVETSVFAEKNLQKFRVIFGGKDRFVIKIPVLTPKTRFSRRKEYFTSEIVFYIGNLSFCREKLAEIPGFIRWKRPFRNKNTSFNTKTRNSFLVEKSTLYLK